MNTNMRILHIINNLGAGGAEKLLHESLPILNKYDGIKTEVLLLTDFKVVFDKKIIDGGSIVHVVPLRNPRSPLNIFYIWKFISKKKYDIIHVHLFPAEYWLALAQRLIFRKKNKLVVTVHSTYNSRRDKLYFKYIDKFIYSSYDSIISISKKTQENLLNWVHPKKKELNKYKVIENGVNVERFINAKPYKRYEIIGRCGKDTKLVCMVGRFNKPKDHNTLIRAISNLPDNIHLILVGRGKLEDDYKDLVKKLGIENRVHFLGFREDVENIMKMCDVVVVSSLWEGFGLAAVEGMASGKPVIASNVEGLREVVKGAGILFESGNIENLSNEIRKILMNQEEYNRMSESGLQRAKNYGIYRMVDRYISLYYEIKGKDI